MKIGLFDSGIGGTTILDAIKKVLPNEDYKYIADSKNCPYGEKTDEELKTIVTANVEELKSWGAEIIVIACNTATTRCISYLREKYPELKFVGTEPAIKLAADTNAKNILVMATPGTIESERTKSLLLENQKPGQNIELLACPGLADTIEANYEQKNFEPITDYLRNLFSTITNTPDIIVLGCTHYSLVKEQIQSFYKDATLIDGNDGVARQVKELVQEKKYNKILLLGYGKEGKSAEKYFKSHFNCTIDILENFTRKEIESRDFSNYDLILRSPSVPPLHLKNESSLTRYFFDNCPCHIIGVTATKGKGTTCSFIKSILDSLGEDAYLVGNIGIPSIEILDNLKSTSVVVYEMSSFQLWDLEKSPHIAVVGTIEPDHLNVHDGFEDYINTKANICRYQTASDFCIFFKNNPDSVRIAKNGNGEKIAYPFEVSANILESIVLPGAHNRENAIAAIAAVSCYKNQSINDFCEKFNSEIRQGLTNFHGLPHRLEYVRTINNISYYDDNFSTNPSSTRVAVNAFPDSDIAIIVGGRDKTNNEDLTEIYEILKTPNIVKIVLMGESGHEIASRFEDSRFTLAESLEEAVTKATEAVADSGRKSVVLMSPSAASFDMFENVYDRGAKYQSIVKALQ